MKILIGGIQLNKILLYMYEACNYSFRFLQDEWIYN